LRCDLAQLFLDLIFDVELCCLNSYVANLLEQTGDLSERLTSIDPRNFGAAHINETAAGADVDLLRV